MSDYRAKKEVDQLLAALTVLDPQPRSEGVKPVNRNFALGGTVWETAYYIELVWDFLETPAEVAAIYGIFGLDSAKSYPVTIYAWNDDYVYKRYNGVAIKPIPSWNNYFARSVIIVVQDLKEIV